MNLCVKNAKLESLAPPIKGIIAGVIGTVTISLLP
jgi:hypothetical protein